MKIIIATKNQGKVREFRRMLAPLGYEAISAQEAGISLEVEETGESFLENAVLKARAICAAAGAPAIGDDSGLCVDALGGAPGIFSARYSDPGATDDRNIDKLLDAMREVPAGERGAHFECVVACVFPDGRIIKARGQCFGSIAFEREPGAGGFGYDPIFLVDGGSFASISDKEKDSLSHRGKALRRLLTLLNEENDR